MALRRLLIAFGGALLAAWTPRLALAQYSPIPNYAGVGAGKQFRTDINNHLSGVTPIAPRLVPYPFAQLPPEQDGQLYWCLDCQQTIPCTGGGAGAFALGAQGQWECAAPSLSGTLTSNLNANGKRIINLGADITTGDALSRGQSSLNVMAAANANYSMGGNKLTSLGAPTTSGDALSQGNTGKLVGNGATLDTTVSPPIISGFNDNGKINAGAYGTFSGGSTNTVTCNTTSGSNSVTCSSASDFANGQWVNLANAGATCGSVGSNCTALSSAPTGTFRGTAGSTTYRYAVATGDGLGGWSTLSPVVGIGSAAAMLNNQNVDTLNFTATAADTEYAICRCSGASCTPNQYIGSVMNGPTYGSYSAGTVLFFDFLGTWQASTTYAGGNFILDSNGNIERATTQTGTSGSGSHPTWPTTLNGTVSDGTITWQLVATPPPDVANVCAGALHDDLTAKIGSGGGTTSWTLLNSSGGAANAGVTLSGAATGHDDAPIFNLAFAAVYDSQTFGVPPGTYVTRSRITIPGGTGGGDSTGRIFRFNSAEIYSFYNGPVLMFNGLTSTYNPKDTEIDGLNIVGQGLYNLLYGAQWGVMSGDSQSTTWLSPHVELVGGGGYFVAKSNTFDEQVHFLGVASRWTGSFAFYAGPGPGAPTLMPDDIEVVGGYFNSAGKLIPQVTGDTNLVSWEGFCATYFRTDELSMTDGQWTTNTNDDGQTGFTCARYIQLSQYTSSGNGTGASVSGSYFESNANAQTNSYDDVIGDRANGLVESGELHNLVGAGAWYTNGALSGIYIRSSDVTIQGAGFCSSGAANTFQEAVKVGTGAKDTWVHGIHDIGCANSTPQQGWVAFEDDTATGIFGPTPDNANTRIFGTLQAYEIAAPSGVAAYDLLWPDSTAHRFKMSNNGGTATIVGNGDAGSCTNQVVTAVNSGSAPTCSSLSQAMAATGFHRSFWQGVLAGSTTATTMYFNISGSSPTESTVAAPVSAAATLKNLYCTASAAPGTGNSDVISVRVAGSTTGVTC